MHKDTGKGLALVAVGIAMGAGYLLYLAREMRSGVSEVRVSFYLVFISLLLIAVGAMQSILGAQKTKELMSFNTAKLSKRDLMMAAIIVVVMLGVIVGMTMFLGNFGYTSF
ncbi:MAG TPA: hypothetical protein VIE88_05785 [Vicinamibacteria bacterium]|jgi:hypothetical protein